MILYRLNFPAALSALTTSEIKEYICVNHLPAGLHLVQFLHADIDQKDLQRNII